MAYCLSYKSFSNLRNLILTLANTHNLYITIQTIVRNMTITGKICITHAHFK